MENKDQEKEIKKVLLNLYRIKNNLNSLSSNEEENIINKKSYIEQAVKEISKIDKDICKILDIKFTDKDKNMVIELIG